MSRFVMCNHPKPLVKIQAPEEGMRPTVRAQLALAVFLEQLQRALAQLPEARSIASFSPTSFGSSGIGVLARRPRHSASWTGRCRRLISGTCGGALLTNLAAPLVILVSTIVRCAITSAADHAPERGGVCHTLRETASAAESSPPLARARCSRIGTMSAMAGCAR